MSPADYAAVLAAIRDQDEEPPGLDAPFAAEQLPGWADGDYPAWLQREMDEFLSDAEWSSVATRVVTFVNGSYWHVEPKTFDRLRGILESKGYTLSEAAELKFW
jgi:hypothetical protein